MPIVPHDATILVVEDNADNLFIMGASTFPQQPAYNPTGPVGALAYWSAEAIVTKYLKSPGPLVHA